MSAHARSSKRAFLRRALTLSLALGAALSVASARAETSTEASETETNPDFPKRLAITVVASESLLATFGARVQSWFTDDTQVSVTVTSEVDLEQMLSSDTSEVRAWIIPLSPERALVSFSSVTAHSSARHLVREVRLRDGFDELGQERIASMIHSAFVALREGTDGFERAQAERALGDVGLTPETHTPPAEFSVKPPAPAPTISAPKPALPPNKKKRTAPAELLIAAGYGAGLRGSEGVGHGLQFAIGAQIPTARVPIDALVSTQVLFTSNFEAAPFDVSEQTTALRAHIGIEPRLSERLSALVLLGAGADLAQIHTHANPNATSDLIAKGRGNGSQWRGASELALGLVRHNDAFDLGVYLRFTLFLEDVHYVVGTARGDQRLVTPWALQPALVLQARFRTGL